MHRLHDYAEINLMFSRCAFAAVLTLLSLSSIPAQAQDAAVPPLSTVAGPDDADYDHALFINPIPAAQLAPLQQLAGKTVKDARKDKQLRSAIKLVVPDCEYHYGRDMPLNDALDLAFDGSEDRVQLLGGRYLFLSGARGPYLGGRAFLWIDTVDGIGLGGFFFQPTNGEPTPALSVFSRQVTDLWVTIHQLPKPFLDAMKQWATAVHLPPVATRYFLTGSKKRILLQHDEDFCVHPGGALADAADPCQQQMAYAADVDEVAAYYLVQIHYATNGTAWMLGEDQTAWLSSRNVACGRAANPLICRVGATREHTRILLQHPMQQPRRRS